MRFKKLKIFVAISLIVFTLIVANTIAFGLLQTRDNSNLVTTIDSKKNSSVVDTTNTSNQTSVNQNPTPQTPVDNTPVIVNHPATRTRAS